MEHTLACSLASADCKHSVRDIVHCVVCGAFLEKRRNHVDVCSGACYRSLLNMQRTYNRAQEGTS